MSNLIVEFILFALQLLFWWTVSSILVNFLLRQSSTRNKEIEHILQHVNEIVHRVKIEEHHNVYYWYDADSDVFLAQGSDVAEIAIHLKSRYPGHIFLLEEKDAVFKLSAPEWKMVKLPQIDAG
jgi:hypothetical protein